MKKPLIKKIVVLLVGLVALIGLDQFVKVLTIEKLAGNSSTVLIPGVFQLTYVENRGAAFGIFQGNVLPLAVLSLVVAAVLIVLYFKVEDGEGAGIIRIAVLLIIAGALGNQYDRIFRTFVVDTFDFCLINFPVFNVADSFVVIGGGLLIAIAVFVPKYLDLIPYFKSKEAEIPTEEEANE